MGSCSQSLVSHVLDATGKIKRESHAIPAGFRLRDFLCLRINSPGSLRMSAYVIVDIEIHDAAGYDEYRKVVGATLSAYGGNFVVRGGRIDVLEGSWNPKRIVVLEFDSATRAREWYDSEEYRVPKQM